MTSDPAPDSGGRVPVAEADAAALQGLPVHRAIAAAAARLAAAGVDAPAVDARLLAAAALELDRAGLLAQRDRPLAPDEAAALAALVGRRAVREPVSRILGRREFWSLGFAVTPATLDPRADSETLVAAVLDRLGDRREAWRILDLGTGSGCLLLALLAELPAARGIGVDRDPVAARAARDNARRLGLADRARFAVGDWAESIRGPVDAIVANPPYIATQDIDALAPEVARYDPRPALDGGPDGLDAYRRIIPQAATLLAPRGFLALEVGATQSTAVAAMADAAGFGPIATIADLGGLPRVVIGQKSLGEGGFCG